MESGCKGSVVSWLRELGGSGQSVRKIVKEVSDEAVKSCRWIWIRRSNNSWGPAGGALMVRVSGGWGPFEPFETRWSF